MAEHYHWPHDFWRRMGVNEFNAWVEITRSRGASDPERWQGAERDPFWDHARHAQGR